MIYNTRYRQSAKTPQMQKTTAAFAPNLQPPRLLRIHLHLIASNLLDSLKRRFPSIQLALFIRIIRHRQRRIPTEPFSHIDHPASRACISAQFRSHVGTARRPGRRNGTYLQSLNPFLSCRHFVGSSSTSGGARHSRGLWRCTMMQSDSWRHCARASPGCVRGR